MKSDERESGQSVICGGRATLHGPRLRTLEALFRHPTAHNLEWMDVIGLFDEIGTVHQKPNAKFTLELAGQHYILQKAHGKNLARSDVVDLRHFLQRAGWSPDGSSTALARPQLEPATLIAVVNHHGSRIYRIEPGSDEGSPRKITPYDPHHFLHHFAHKDQSREEGQRASEDPGYYGKLGDALAAAGNILVIGHGKGKSNAARHLVEYLRVHRHETYQRVVRELETDLSAITSPQLLELAEQAFGSRS